MTTTPTTSIAASPLGAAGDPGLGPIAYRPGATYDTVGLVLYGVITVPGRLIIVAATPDDAPVHTLHRRTTVGQIRRCPLAEGFTAWASAEVKVDNLASVQVASQLTDRPPADDGEPFVGPVAFTGTDPDSTRPISLTPQQVLLLRAVHARAPRGITG
jgi:hypothetical protein